MEEQIKLINTNDDNQPDQKEQNDNFYIKHFGRFLLKFNPNDFADYVTQKMMMKNISEEDGKKKSTEILDLGEIASDTYDQIQKYKKEFIGITLDGVQKTNKWRIFGASSLMTGATIFGAGTALLIFVGKAFFASIIGYFVTAAVATSGVFLSLLASSIIYSKKTHALRTIDEGSLAELLEIPDLLNMRVVFDFSSNKKQDKQDISMKIKTEKTSFAFGMDQTLQAEKVKINEDNIVQFEKDKDKNLASDKKVDGHYTKAYYKFAGSKDEFTSAYKIESAR